MFWFLKSVRVKLFKTLSAIYHNLYVWYYDHSKVVIFKLHLNFIHFLPFYHTIFIMIRELSAENLASFHVHSLREMSHEHEYHFLNKFTLWFYALAVHIGPIRKNYVERSKIVKYSKQRQNGANYEHVHCTCVCWARKKFEVDNVKFFWKLCRE
jgi:hypothetical protein